MSNLPLLEVDHLQTSFLNPTGEVRAVDGVSFSVMPGKTLGLVGESGCGKSVMSLSLLRLVPGPYGKIVGGKVLYRGQNLLDLPLSQMRTIRGREISMVFQDPMTALNPVFTIGNQIREVIALHQDLSRADTYNRAVEMLKLVGIASPEKRINDYPHQLSGGMRQRAMIAMALSCNPSLLIADEPNTSLDVTIQAQILDLLRDLQSKVGMAVILITHDLGVIAEMADDVAVMYAGKIVEYSSAKDLFSKPRHPYTQGLLKSIPTRGLTRLEAIPGMVPDLKSLPKGCRFQDRCQWVKEDCLQVEPKMRTPLNSSHHQVRCVRDL